MIQQTEKILTLLKKTFELLKHIEPQPDEYDIRWFGPYFVPRPREWHPSHFLFYNGHLYCSIAIRWHEYAMTWKVGTNDIKYETGWGSQGDYFNDEYLWSKAMSQIYKRLKTAIDNPTRYNKQVAKYLPFAYRQGKILRHYTWEKKVKSIIPMKKIHRMEELLDKSAKLPKLSKMTLRMYLEMVGVAKDAVFKDSRSLPLIEKYQKRADTRHGGLLDLPFDDVDAFERWYHSGCWSGSHPWEIVFGHPHGIMFSPHHNKDGWNYSLWVDSLGWYKEAAYMAIALGEKGIPFEFYRNQEVIDALKGADLVEIGPFYGMLSFEELKEERPDAIEHIQWEPISQILPVTSKQKERMLSLMSEKKKIHESKSG